MRVIFAGTPVFAARALEALIDAGHDLVLVLTQPDRPAGRGMKLQASAVKTLALDKGITVFQPERLKDPVSHEPIRVAAADVMVVVAYGLILPQAVLDLPRHGCLNIHASLLPRWRGAAPIHRAVEAGDAQTGITIMQMDAGLDTGPMLMTEAMSIETGDSTGSLHDRLADMGARMIVAALAELERQGALRPQTQPEIGVSYAPKIDKQEAHLDWRSAATVLERKVRAYNPFPGATLVLGGKPVKVWRALAEATVTVGSSPGQVLAANADGIVVACGEGCLRLLELQSPGNRRVSCGDYLRGISSTDLIQDLQSIPT